MQARFRRIAFVCTMLFAAGACADTPTAPPAIADHPTPSKAVTYYPGDPGQCDPWLDANWCKERDPVCMTSTLEDGSPDEFVASQSACGGGPGGGGDPSPPPPTSSDTTCQTDNAVVNDLTVQAGFKNLWEQSGYGLAQNQRREAGAWIVQDPGGSYRLVPLSDAVSTPCSINGNWNAPPGTVGWVHTHPFTAGEQMTACGPMTIRLSNGQEVPIVGRDGQPVYHRYRNLPSPADRDLLQNVINGVRKQQGKGALEGYVIDNERITRYTGTNAMKDVGYDRCGY